METNYDPKHILDRNITTAHVHDVISHTVTSRPEFT